ncbi:MAG: signal peptide peptidase SppA [candidate division WOR-3 bacterium]
MKRETLIILIVVIVLAVFVLFGLVARWLMGVARRDFVLSAPWAGAIGYVEIEGTITDSRETIRQLKALERNPLVKGILIRVESPGGVVTPAHEIYSEIRRIRENKVPVVVSMGTVAASGGYYVATPADVIVANPGTLTGSIGVIMEVPVLRGLMDKVGVKVEVVKSREAKDLGSPFRDMTDRDRQLLQEVVSDVYEQFVKVVSEERKLPMDSVRRIADGRILTGRQAQELGLVDSLGTLEDAKRICGRLAGIRGEPRLVRSRPRLNYWLRRLLEEGVAKLLGLPQFPRLSYRWF